ncbi:hypothetical protein PPM_p0140 (plasmid) [Paenibacillus polymyxa M1]|uniref:hypothetical protein n=1 Tax=Paenibacillus polymyxa TaxID=1406 RepID=UPI00021BBB78|nr:hypothetical protein [Paenibacillus polymyxa]CCC86290.1 hypothetical protein PPM_p0140 [Paenibacillus polymyxa M1]
MTQFSVGLFDRLFGKKTTLELSDGSGGIVKRTVTEKWLETMQEQGKISVVRESALDSISTEMAVGFVFKAAMDDLSLKWENIKSEIIGYDVIFNDVPEEWAQFEFILASIGLDLLAVYNLYSKEQAIEIHEQVLTLVGKMDEIGENSSTAVHDYYLVASDAVSNAESPLEYVASFLCHRLDLAEDIGPIALTGIMAGITQLAGKWRWIEQNFTVSA